MTAHYHRHPFRAPFQLLGPVPSCTFSGFKYQTACFCVPRKEKYWIGALSGSLRHLPEKEGTTKIGELLIDILEKKTLVQKNFVNCHPEWKAAGNTQWLLSRCL